MKRIIALASTILLVVMLAGCSTNKNNDENKNMSDGNTYTSISQEEAMEKMESETDYIILDVRTKEEYDEGHIKGAINVDNYSISDEPIESLPDKEQLIFVYCRSGNRSKAASEKLAAMGYSNIYEIGGINTWTGDIEK